MRKSLLLLTTLCALGGAALADSAEGTTSPANVAQEAFETGAVIGPACVLGAFNTQKVRMGPFYWNNPLSRTILDRTRIDVASVQCNPGTQFTLTLPNSIVLAYQPSSNGGITYTPNPQITANVTLKTVGTVPFLDLTTISGTTRSFTANRATFLGAPTASNFVAAKPLAITFTIPSGAINVNLPTGLYLGTYTATLTITAPTLVYP